MYCSKSVNVFKILFSAILQLLVFSGVTFLPQDYSALPILGGAVMSVFPYVFTLFLLKHSHPKRALTLILGDLWRVVGVSVMTCVICEVALLIAYGENQYRGFMTLVLALIYVMVWACYSLVFFIRIKSLNRGEAANR